MEANESIQVNQEVEQQSGGLLLAWDQRPQGLVVCADCCTSPDCPCRTIDVALFEVAVGLQRATRVGLSAQLDFAGPPPAGLATLRASVDLESGYVAAIGEDRPELRRRFQKLCDEKILERLRALWVETKHRGPSWETADWSYFEEGQTLIPWNGVSPGEPDSFDLDERTYLTFELYCGMERCPCNEVAVDVAQVMSSQVDREGEESTLHTLGGFRIDLATSQAREFVSEDRSTATQALLRRLADAYLARHPGLERARRRKRRMMEIGPRILDLSMEQQLGPRLEPHRAAPKVAPNDRCPCGSGKKYKRCCGAA